MDLRSYCDNVQIELTGWKAKVYDVVRRLNNLHTEDKEKVFPMVQDLRMIVEELSDRIDKLEKECPTEWDPHRSEIEGTMSQLRDRWKSTWEEMSGADIGG